MHIWVLLIHSQRNKNVHFLLLKKTVHLFIGIFLIFNSLLMVKIISFPSIYLKPLGKKLLQNEFYFCSYCCLLCSLVTESIAL